MAKKVRKKTATTNRRNPELELVANEKRTLKKIYNGQREISRLTRAIVAARATAERELAALARYISERNAIVDRADDSLEAAHG
jgi:hypothetical protein